MVSKKIVKKFNRIVRIVKLASTKAGWSNRLTGFF